MKTFVFFLTIDREKYGSLFFVRVLREPLKALSLALHDRFSR